MFKSYAHLFIWAFCLVVLAVLGVLAIDLGIVDAALGTSTQAALHDWWKYLQDSYGLHGQRIETAFKVIGLAFTAAFGTLAFLQGLHYAHENLPVRLAEFNERIKNARLQVRAALLAPYASYNLKGEQMPSAPMNRFERVLSVFKADPFESYRLGLMKRASVLDAEIKVAATNLVKCKTERITAHLVAGLRLAHEARSMNGQTAAQIARSEAALAEFRKALELDENDLDALEYAAKQANVLNLKPAVRDYLERMERVADEQRRPIQKARALRYQAETQLDNNVGRRTAYQRLNAALEILDAPDVGPEKPFELALVNEQLAALHIRRGTFTLVTPCLNEARKLYSVLPMPHGPAGLLRVEQLRARLAKGEQGEDEPDDPEPPDTTFSTPTHVTVERIRVFVAGGGRGAVVHTLEPFTVVTRVRAEQGWALIAKDGEPLGYVPEGKLRELN